MKRIFFVTILLTVGFSLILKIPPVDSKVPDIILEQKNTVVTIYINNKDGKHIFSGSGFIVDQNGIIATNCLIIAKWLEKVENIFDVELHGGVHLPMEDLISSKCINNLALFKVKAEGLPTVKLTADYMPKQGENIVFIGGPSESGSAIVGGIIKNVRENDKLFHLSIPITPERSGSPVFNMKGEVIGAAVYLPKKGKNFNLAVFLKDFTKYLDKYKKPKMPDKRETMQETLKEVNKFTGDATEYFLRGCTYDKVKMYKEAISAYQQSLKIKPDFFDACVNLGIDYYELGQYEDAITIYKQAIQINPNSTAIYNKLGTAYILQGAYSLALETFKKVTDIEPRSADAHFNLGITYLIKGDTTAAFEEYTILEDIDKERAESLKDLIY